MSAVCYSFTYFCFVFLKIFFLSENVFISSFGISKLIGIFVIMGNEWRDMNFFNESSISGLILIELSDFSLGME